MAEAIKEDELGRSKQSTAPADHLLHLLSIGWDPKAPLIQKFVQQHSLQRQLDEWLKTIKKG